MVGPPRAINVGLDPKERDMQTYLNIVQILISIVLIIAILMQVKEAGSGLFGSGQASFRTRRGMERTLFRFTIALVVAFILVAILTVQLT